MSLIVDTFQAAKFLPIHVTHDGIELIETALEVTRVNDTIFVESGEDKASTPQQVIDLLSEYFPEILEQAIEEDCDANVKTWSPVVRRDRQGTIGQTLTQG